MDPTLSCFYVQLQFKLIGAFKMGHYTTGQSVIYKKFQDVKTREVTGVKWTHLRLKNDYTDFVREHITKFPNLEGFIMELGNTNLYTRVSEQHDDTNDDDADDEAEANYVCIAVIKLKCTSRTKHLQFKECNENGKNEKTTQSDVVWRAKWRTSGENSKTRWVRIMNFDSESKNECGCHYGVAVEKTLSVAVVAVEKTLSVAVVAVAKTGFGIAN